MFHSRQGRSAAVSLAVGSFLMAMFAAAAPAVAQTWDLMNVLFGSCGTSLVLEGVGRCLGVIAVDTLGGISDEVQAAVRTLASTCWSCEMYIKLFDGLMKVVADMNALFLNTPEIVGTAVLVIMCVLVIRVLAMIGSPVLAGVDLGREVYGIAGYLGRIAVVFLLFFTGLVAAMSGPGGDDSHPARLLFLDGPLLIGTEIGVRLIEGGQGLVGAAVNVRECPYATGSAGGGGLVGGVGQHVSAACGILNSFHQMGVAGIATGSWLALKAPSSMNNPGIGAMVSVVLAGIVMAGAFLWFTVIFGLRYLDALLRGLIVLAFLPVFLFFWLFDRTRSIAMSGLKSVIFMSAIFAVSGITFLLCNAIMAYGFQKASGGSLNVGAAQSFLESMSAGGFNWLIGSGSEGTNWLAFFYVMGCWGLATQLARATFAIAAEFVDFTGGLMGVGEQTESDVKGVATSVAGRITPFGK